MKITEKKEQPLLSRVAFKGLIGFEATTPSRLDLKKAVAHHLKVDESNVAVSSINTAFGEKKAQFEAHVYTSPQELDKFESVVVLRRQGLREKKATAAKEKK